MAKEAKLLAGTTFAVDLLDDANYIVIEGVESFGSVGDLGEAKESTTVSDVRKTYGVGIDDSPEMTIVGQWFEEANADQKAFVTRAKAREQFKVKISYPNGVSGIFTVRCLGFQVSEGTAEDWMKYSIPARKNTVTEWTYPV